MPKPLTITTPTDREIVVVREFDAPRDLVFRCFTVPELIRRWYGLPDWQMTLCEFDARVGGRWRFISRAPNGFEMKSSGEIREFEPTTRIVNTETYEMDWTGGETVVTTLFDEAEGLTTVTLTVLYGTKEARDGAKATPMATGMEVGFKRLDETLAAEQRR
jgi:uncharacterized protein YndB with AHSA1/START domain